MNLLSALLLLAGSAICLVAALGLLRLPDYLARLHAAGKAGAFGAVLILAGALLHFRDLHAALLTSLALVLYYLTAPVTAHLLARAGRIRRLPLDPATQITSRAASWTEPPAGPRD